MRSHALLILLTVCLTPPTVMAAKTPFGLELGRYHALIISSQNYQHLTPLKTPHGDAEALAAVLRADYGFKVTMLRDANRATTLDALDRFVEKLTPNDNLLIFYAGHGHLDPATGEGYWLPVTANPRRRSEWISNSDISDTLRATTARHVLVISDSCFSGTLTRSAGAGLSVGSNKLAYFEKLASKRSRTSLSSGGLEPVDDGGSDGHSVFSGALITALQRNNEPLLEAESLYSRIRRPVSLNSSALQKPRYSDVRATGHDEGDFLFYKRNLRPQKRPPAARQIAPTVVDSSAAYELTFWDSIKGSKDARDFQAYLETYPQGQFATLARLRVRQLGQAGNQPDEKAPPAAVVVAAIPAKPARISQAKPARPPTSLVDTILIVQATPDTEYSPEFTSITEYSRAIAKLVSNFYKNRSVVMLAGTRLTRDVIGEGGEHSSSKALCSQYQAKKVFSIELDMSRDIEELTRTPDELHFAIYDCARESKQVTSYPIDFQQGEAFTYAAALQDSLQKYDRAFSPLE